MTRDVLVRLPAAHLLAASLCVGLALALLLREAHAGLLLAAVAALVVGLLRRSP